MSKGLRLPNGTRFVAERSGAARCINIYAPCDRGCVVPTLRFEEVEEGDVMPAFLSLDFKEAQMIMDEMFACGVRPSQGGDSAGVVEAQKAHIADLQNQLKNMWIWHANLLKMPEEGEQS